MHGIKNVLIVKSKENITLDHVLPQCKGGLDIKTNVVACCHSCNQSKGHTPWEQWYYNQDFFSDDNYDKIKNVDETRKTI
jgi:hypothetical protein